MASVARTFDVSVWQRGQSRFVHLPGRHDEARVNELRAKGHELRAYPIEVIDDGRVAKIAEIDRMLADVQDRCLRAVDRYEARKTLLAMKARLLAAWGPT